VLEDVMRKTKQLRLPFLSRPFVAVANMADLVPSLRGQHADWAPGRHDLQSILLRIVLSGLVSRAHLAAQR
jgi:hypothetical protein